MALSLRKAPKFRRKGYQRLQERRPWDSCNNEYIFPENQGESDVEPSSDSIFELSEASTRNRLHCSKTGHGEEKASRDRKDKKDFLTYEIQHEDTLQGIALKYGCSVSELKRVNNLLQDQDVFALREIMIPAREHSILFEIFSQPKSSCSSGSENSKTFHVSINQMIQNKSDKEPSQFLKDMDKDIQQMVEKAQSQQSIDLERQTSNSLPVIRPLVNSYYDGANWGINWYCLLVVLLVISVLAPVTYGIYFATVAHSQEGSDNNNNTESSR